MSTAMKLTKQAIDGGVRYTRQYSDAASTPVEKEKVKKSKKGEFYLSAFGLSGEAIACLGFVDQSRLPEHISVTRVDKSSEINDSLPMDREASFALAQAACVENFRARRNAMLDAMPHTFTNTEVAMKHYLGNKNTAGKMIRRWIKDKQVRYKDNKQVARNQVYEKVVKDEQKD